MYSKHSTILSALKPFSFSHYLFSDGAFLEKLAVENPDIFQKAWDKVKYFCKTAGPNTKEGKLLDKAKQLYEQAYRQAADAKKNATGNGGVKYSITETTDGRPVAVVDTDILKDVDTSDWNKETKKEVRKAATDALRQFKDGFEINGITYVDNKKTRREYTKSDYSETLADKSPTSYQDKMRAADVVDDVIHVATEWTRDGKLKHKRSDFVDFVRGKALFQSGDNSYSATVLAGITKDGKAVFYDVVDVMPDSFEVKKSGLPSTVLTETLPDSMQGSPDLVGRSVKVSDAIPIANSIAPDGKNVKHSLLENSDISTPKTGADVFREDIAYTPDPNDLAPIGENVVRTAPMEDGFAPTAEDEGFDEIMELPPSSRRQATVYRTGTRFVKDNFHLATSRSQFLQIVQIEIMVVIILAATPLTQALNYWYSSNIADIVRQYYHC